MEKTKQVSLGRLYDGKMSNQKNSYSHEVGKRCCQPERVELQSCPGGGKFGHPRKVAKEEEEAAEEKRVVTIVRIR